jgi:hypothetical protein
MEQLHKALESIDAYRGCLEESLTQRENFIGAIRDAQRSQVFIISNTNSTICEPQVPVRLNEITEIRSYWHFWRVSH